MTDQDNPDIETELAGIAEDLALLLSADPDIVLHYSGEETPFHLDFLYTPSAERIRNLNIKKEKKESIFLSGSLAADQGERVKKETIARNQKCTLCHDKLFALRKYRRSAAESAPVLLLTYPGGLRDSTDELIFSCAGEDELFFRMMRAAGIDPEKHIVYQQYPACVFNAERSDAEDWNRRNTNCLELVAETVREFRVKAVLATGQSAVFLAGEEIARKHSVSGTPLDFRTESGNLPLYIIRSPAAVLAFEKKRMLLKERAAKSPEDSSVLKLLADHIRSEKELKNNILRNIKIIKEKYV